MKSLANHPGGLVLDQTATTDMQNDGAVFVVGKGWDLTKRSVKKLCGTARGVAASQ